MIGRDEESEDSSIDLVNVKLIADKIKVLDDASSQVREDIKSCFERLGNALRSREKQLLRQVEAIHAQQISLLQSNTELDPSASLLFVNLKEEEDVQNRILSLGTLELPGKTGIAVKDAEPYKVQEYQEAERDHVSFDKSIKVEECEDNVQLTPKSKSGEEIRISSCKGKSGGCILNAPSSSCTSSFTSNLDNSAAEDTVVLSKHSPFHNERDSSPSNCHARITSPGKKSSTEEKISDVETGIRSEHPKQVQQWLKQILLETETEPTVHETGHFLEISTTRLCREFPLET
ncbi:uncharacterized protein LOC105695600 [Orussus abietinus]|uniref:uncharacterized protein LOC105695600 n=1 Tax=Orussus abietinus TaxID=222816 RepID=UPI000626B9C0|nr:uncharacterized protein LOC105695600 [Orussus abietinus]